MPLIYMFLLKLPPNAYTVGKSVLIADILKKSVRPLPPNYGAGGGIKHSQITSCAKSSIKNMLDSVTNLYVTMLKNVKHKY